MNIIEFAREIGVSPTTVSRALSGRGRISENTRQMIHKRMSELGYMPNPHAQSLVTGRSRMILLHHSDRGILSDMFLVEMAHGIQQALEEQGYGLLLDTAHSTPDKASDLLLNQWINSRAVDGVIVKPLRPNREWLEQFCQSGIPCVVIGDPSAAELPHVGAVSVRVDNGICEAAKLFVELGHTRIGFIGTSMPDRALDVFRRQLQVMGVDLPDDMVVMSGLQAEDGGTAMRKLLENPRPPTAALVRLDTLAVGAMHAASNLGLRVPDDISIIGYGDIPLAGMLNPPLTTVRVDFFGLGQLAMSTLFELIDNQDKCIEPKFIDTTLVVRESVSKL